MHKFVFERIAVYVCLPIVIILGAYVRLSAVFMQPLWLDEKYSLYFAKVLEFSEFFISTPDNHPGMYYFIVSIFTSVSENMYFLRITTALLPLVIGIALFIYTAYKFYTKDTRTLAVMFVGFWMNPYIINLSWQLRMYGLLTLALSFAWFASECLKRFKSKRYFALFITSVLFAQSLSYIGLFWTIGWFSLQLRLLIRKKWSSDHLYLLITLVLTILQFTLHSLHQVKEAFYHVSWVRFVSLSGAWSILETIMGFKFDTMAVNTTISFLSLLTVFLILLFCIVLWKSYKLRTNILLLIESYVFVPALVVIVLSLVMPFLADRIFFHNFVPKISLFIPRAFLPAYLMAVVFIPILLMKHMPKLFMLTVFIIVFLWCAQLKIFFQPIYANQNTTAELNHVLSKYAGDESVVWLPSWYMINGITSGSDLTPLSREQYERSIEVETIFNSPHDTFSGDNYCSNFNEMTLITPIMKTTTTTKVKNLLNEINLCCYSQSHGNWHTKWTCN